MRLLTDENFNRDIVRGLLLHEPKLDIVHLRDVGLAGADDPAVLAWAADNDRILLTHDRATIAHHAFERVAAGWPMPGVFIFNDRFPIGQAIESSCSSRRAASIMSGPAEWSTCPCR